jgi:hypothetical protein
MREREYGFSSPEKNNQSWQLSSSYANEDENVGSLSSSGNFISGTQGDERGTSNFLFVCRVACRPVNTIYHTWCERSAAVRVGWGLRKNVRAMDIIFVWFINASGDGIRGRREKVLVFSRYSKISPTLGTTSKS